MRLNVINVFFVGFDLKSDHIHLQTFQYKKAEDKIVSEEILHVL